MNATCDTNCTPAHLVHVDLKLTSYMEHAQTSPHPLHMVCIRVTVPLTCSILFLASAMLHVGVTNPSEITNTWLTRGAMSPQDVLQICFHVAPNLTVPRKHNHGGTVHDLEQLPQRVVWLSTEDH